MTDVPYANARAYWPLFGGQADDDTIEVMKLRLKIGGTEAPLAGDRYRVSVYAREHIDGANFDPPIHQEYIDLPDIGEVGLDEAWRYWRDVDIGNASAGGEPRCIVVKVEALHEDPIYTPQNADYVRAYTDQSTTADPPPWGVRIVSYRVYASSLGTKVTLRNIVGDIVSPYWPMPTITGGNLDLIKVTQLAFTEIPNTRRQGLDDVNALVDADYGVWDGNFHFGFDANYYSVMTIDAADPRVTLSLNSDVHETYNACRVKYTGRSGRPREEIVHAGQAEIMQLVTGVKAKTIDAPDAVKNKSQAIKCGIRFLNNHKKATVTGTATLYGISDEWGDAMLIRPEGKLRIKGVPKAFAGPHKITNVTLDPTTWSAQVEFGVQSRRFEVWLARLAAGARVRQR